MARVYNFSAGPSMLPEPVLEIARDQLLEYGCSGQSVMEMSHRSSTFDAIIKGTEAALRRKTDCTLAELSEAGDGAMRKHPAGVKFCTRYYATGQNALAMPGRGARFLGGRSPFTGAKRGPSPKALHPPPNALYLEGCQAAPLL